MSQVSGLAALPVLGSMPEIRRLNQADFSEFGLNDYVSAAKAVLSPQTGPSTAPEMTETTNILSLICVLRGSSRDEDPRTISAGLAAETLPQPVEIQIDYRRGK